MLLRTPLCLNSHKTIEPSMHRKENVDYPPICRSSQTLLAKKSGKYGCLPILIVIKYLFRKNYIPGTPCQKEQAIEDDILDVIKSFETENNSVDIKETTIASVRSHDLDYFQNEASGRTTVTLSPGRSFRNVKDVDNDDYIDQTTFDDVAMMQFDNVRAPFLRTASSDVKEEFRRVWQDINIPSESLRAFKIQMLAVSLLSSQQLSEYNRWATKRRRVLKAREQEIRSLSNEAKRALRDLSVAKDEATQILVPLEIKKELTTFVQRLNRRRSLKLTH
uniref:Uncharacterized protein n=1 Tax=Caenorhabditis japonica TaxID=281687 RepID=A0A8R1EJG2_CAEJA